MTSLTPLILSQLLLETLGVRICVERENRIPLDAPAIVVSNHRSVLDPFVLMKAIDRPLRTACHHYMGEIPVVRELVHLLGCFPFEKPKNREPVFFEQASALLRSQQWLAIFPEGASPMVRVTHPKEMSPFHRGFAHLALRASVPNLAVLPVAIASLEERIDRAVPVRALRLFDPSEPLFDRGGIHPMVTYRRVNIVFGRPYWITPALIDRYQGKEAKKVVTELTNYCRDEIAALLNQQLRDRAGEEK
ncbi:MAG: lysophospholipid acyltransferase family protein [Cyanobacteriota bacterium]|nr:lysophospholipid acyltransferase family protein [Cyanobacteriota bacterium]